MGRRHQGHIGGNAFYGQGRDILGHALFFNGLMNRSRAAVGDTLGIWYVEITRRDLSACQKHFQLTGILMMALWLCVFPSGKVSGASRSSERGADQTQRLKDEETVAYENALSRPGARDFAQGYIHTLR